MPRVKRSLTDKQALWAMEVVASGRMNMKRVAESLQVSQTVINLLIQGRSYQHLQRPAGLPGVSTGTYRRNPETPERRRLREARFWALVDMSAQQGGCWPFSGRRNRDGYGQFSAGKGLIGVVSAHRVAYLLAHGLRGNLPTNICVRHLCASPPCCNPDHLVVGTQGDNMFDRFQVHRNQPGPHPVDTPSFAPSGGWKIAVGRLEELERAALVSEFWQKVDRSNGETACWPWLGASRHEFGYGAVYWEGRHTQAARVAYLLHHELTFAELHADLVLRHLCPDGSNPGCCNPLHLALGTHKENMQDRMSAGNYSRGDEHFATKLKDVEVKKLREAYWTAPHGRRPTLQSLARQHDLYWGTVHRLLHGRLRVEAGGPIGELSADVPSRTNHARGEAHCLVKVSDARVKELREEYWGTPREQRPSTVALGERFETDSKTVWNWLHGKSRISAGGPTSELGGDSPIGALF